MCIRDRFFGETRADTHSLENYYRGGAIVPSQGPTGGQSAIHQIAVDPSASSVMRSGGPEEFFIYLTGNSGTETVRTQIPLGNGINIGHSCRIGTPSGSRCGFTQNGVVITNLNDIDTTQNLIFTTRANLDSFAIKCIRREIDCAIKQYYIFSLISNTIK